MLLSVTAKLVLEFSAEVLDALRKAGHLHIQLTVGSAAGAPAAPRAGSLPARILAWAQKRSRSFGVADIERRFKVSRAHASMLLGRLARGPGSVRREARGVYVFKR